MIVARNLTQRYSVHTTPSRSTGERARAGSGRAVEPESSATLTVLDGVDLEIHDGESVVILGPSGSGKTTLLGLLAGLDRPSAGDVEIAGVPLSSLDEDQRAALRADRIGFIFQNFHLIPTLTALENVLVPLELLPDERALGSAEANATARELLERVGLGSRLDHYPAQLSGGEQQRVGIARAFANRPVVLFADEPTGNLDRATGEEIANLLFDLNRQQGATLVIVTHDLALSRRAHRIVHLAGGRIDRIEELAVPEPRSTDRIAGDRGASR
jgi:putative ABC transport system ATP-binding protein